MAEKDTAEKILADYNDVFADIVNVLLFQGERMISPNQLQSVNVHSQYKADGKIVVYFILNTQDLCSVQQIHKNKINFML